MSFLKYIFITALILPISNCKTQNNIDYENDLIKLKIERQRKLDTGDKMMLTDRQFMFDTDSILEIVYNKLLEKNDSETKSKLVEEQKEWEKRKAYLTDSLWKPVTEIFEETGITPQLEREIAYSTIANLNYDRAIELNKKLNQKQ